MPTLDFKTRAQVTRLSRMKTDLPKQLSNLGQNFFSRSFQASTWEGKPWAQRKRETRRSKGKHILVASGRLRASIYHCRRRADFNMIVWGTDVPYAKVHNEGYKGMVRAHTRKITRLKREGRKVKMRQVTGFTTVRSHRMNMPQRKFLGESRELTRLFKAEVSKQMAAIFQ